MRVYVIENTINHKKYIGCTTKPIESRFAEHILIATTNKRNKGFSYLHSAIIKYGKENFNISVLEECVTLQEMYDKEIKCIEKYKTFGECGYNLTNGGEGGAGRIVSKETRKKQSIIAKNRKFSPETRKKMSLSRTGLVFSKETCEKMSMSQLGEKNHRYGKPHTEQEKNHISASMMGNKNHFFGKKHSEETKKIISKKKIGVSLGGKNPAAKTCIYGGKIYATGKELREVENMKLRKFYSLLKNGNITYAND